MGVARTPRRLMRRPRPRLRSKSRHRQKGCVRLLLSVEITVSQKGVSGRDVPKSHRLLTLLEGVQVLPVFWCRSSSVKNYIRRPKRLRWDVGAVLWESCVALDSVSGHALTFWPLPVAETLESSSTLVLRGFRSTEHEVSLSGWQYCASGSLVLLTGKRSWKHTTINR